MSQFCPPGANGGKPRQATYAMKTGQSKDRTGRRKGSGGCQASPLSGIQPRLVSAKEKTRKVQFSHVFFAALALLNLI